MTSPARGRMFASLQEKNVRIFFAGLGVSNIGTWAQTTAVILLIQRLGGGGLEIGLAVAAQFLPVLLLGLWAGAYADRRDRHRLTMKLQTAMGLQAVALGACDLTGVASIPVIYGMQAAIGTLSAIDTPARRAFVTELVDSQRLANVLSLTTSVMTGARIFGPSLAALLVPAIGTGWVFVLNGVSYLALVGAMASMDVSRFHRVEPGPRSATPVRDGLRAVWDDVPLRALVLVLAVIATFTFNHLVYMPLLVAERVGGSERAFGWLLAVLGIGNVAGALSIARLVVVPMRWFYLGGACLGAAVIAIAYAPTPWLIFALALPMGTAMTILISSASVILQQRSDPTLRARMLALSTVILMGSTPIGGPVTGLVADALGVFWATAYGGLVAVVAVAIAGLALYGSAYGAEARTTAAQRARSSEADRRGAGGL